MDLRQRRRSIFKSKTLIGYTEDVGFYSGQGTGAQNSTPVEMVGHFVTGYIPVKNTKFPFQLTCRWDYEYKEDNTPYAIYYDKDKRYIAKNDMFNAHGQRTVSITNSKVAFIVFHGFLRDIDNCFVRNDTDDIILWKKGM